MKGIKRAVTVGVAGLGWAGLALELVNLLPDPVSHAGRISAVFALAGTFRLMLWSHQRPIVRAYELGYAMGRRDQMKDKNTRATVTAIRAVFADRPSAVND